MKLFFAFASLVCVSTLTLQLNAENDPFGQNGGSGPATVAPFVAEESVPDSAATEMGPLWENRTIKRGPIALMVSEVTPETVEGEPMVMLQSVPESISKEIQILAKSLNNDPVAIFNYVRNHIDYEPYHGLRKGAILTLIEGSGNDFDQCALLASLLFAAGYQDISYKYISQRVDYQHLIDWIGLSESPFPGQTFDEAYGASKVDAFGPIGNDISDDVAKQVFAAISTLRAHGLVAPYQSIGVWSSALPSVAAVGMGRLYITLTIDGVRYDLDPAYKVYEKIEAAQNLLTEIGYDRQTLLSALGGYHDENYAQQLSVPALDAYMNNLNGTLVDLINQTDSGISLDEIIKRRRIVRHDIEDLSEAFPLPRSSSPITLTWSSIPDSYKSTVQFSLESLNFKIPTAELSGRKITLTFSGNTAHLRLDDGASVATKTVNGADLVLTTTVTHPGAYGPLTYTRPETFRKKNEFAYSIIYSFSASGRLLQKRYEQLNTYLAESKDAESREVRTELLNIIGLAWLYQTQLVLDILAAQNDVIAVRHHRFGRVSQEEGFYIDVGHQVMSTTASDLSDNSDRVNNVFHLESLFASAMEHGILEQMQPNIKAVSTVNVLRNANNQGYKIYLANSDNWPLVATRLNGYENNLNEFQSLIGGSGATLLLPEQKNIRYQGMGWVGSGWIIRSDLQAGMIINGGFGGGFPTVPTKVSYPKITQNYFSNPIYRYAPSSIPKPIRYAAPSYKTPKFWGSDPVDMATGAFTYAYTDLETSISPIPMGLSFTRQYSSGSNTQDSQNMGYGWTHNLHMRATKRTSSEEPLGLGTPQQAAMLLVATLVGADLYRWDGTPREWLTAALAVGWFQDQMLDNAVSITIGDSQLQFIKQPNGTFLPPAGSTMDLSIIQGGYVLKQRHGNTIWFGYSTMGSNEPQIAYYIQDSEGSNPMVFSYHHGDRLYFVNDAYGHQYVFDYVDNTRISKITDTYGYRSVEFSYDSHGNLITVKDPEGILFHYDYEVVGDPAETLAEDHRMVRLRNQDGGVITQNIYDGLGRVVEQYLHGDTQKTWKLRYTGRESYEEDPEGGITTYYYDERGRSVGKKDADGNFSSWEYDSQDRVIRKTSAEGEILVNTYDSNHNLLRMDLPRGGGSVLYAYDNLHRLTSLTDPEGNITQYTYFSGGFHFGKNRPEKIIDPTGTTTFAYFGASSAPGKLYTVTDADGLVTQNNYNRLGHPIWTIAPGGFVTYYQ